MKFLFILLIFGSFFSNANLNSPIDKETSNSAVKWYNQGVQHYNSQEKIKAIAYFRKALHLDPWLWPAKRALNHLQSSPPFWILIPPEVFLSLIAVSLILLLFSMNISNLVFFCLCLIMQFSFSFYRNIPRITILEETPAHTAPNASSPVLFSLTPGDWLMQLKTSKEWIQIKNPQQAIGWISKIKLHQMDKSYNYEEQKTPE